MNKGPSTIKIGPAGSQSGNAWDEKGHTNIVQIFVSHDDKIKSIQFQYVENGSSVLSERHGSGYAYQFDVVKFSHPKEYITSISGHVSSLNGRLCSIKFGTNSSQYGPFGRFTGSEKEFNFKLGEDSNQFGGFYGTVDSSCVESIGFYLKPNATLCSASAFTRN